MIITFTDKSGNELVEVRSMADGLNYMLYTKPEFVMKDGVKISPKTGREVKGDWSPQYIYASTIEHAITIGIQRAAKMLGENVVIEIGDEGLHKQIVKKVGKVIDQIKAEIEI